MPQDLLTHEGIAYRLQAGPYSRKEADLLNNVTRDFERTQKAYLVREDDERNSWVYKPEADVMRILPPWKPQKGMRGFN